MLSWGRGFPVTSPLNYFSKPIFISIHPCLSAYDENYHSRSYCIVWWQKQKHHLVSVQKAVLQLLQKEQHVSVCTILQPKPRSSHHTTVCTYRYLQHSSFPLSTVVTKLLIYEETKSMDLISRVLVNEPGGLPSCESHIIIISVIRLSCCLMSEAVQDHQMQSELEKHTLRLPMCLKIFFSQWQT